MHSVVYGVLYMCMMYSIVYSGCDGLWSMMTPDLRLRPYGGEDTAYVSRTVRPRE